MTNISAAPAPGSEKTILGHPRGLVILFFTEMWERFSYYGMRALLVIYLTQHFLFSDARSAVMYGAYTALVYIMTIIGGSLADRYLGSRKAVIFGAILLVLGHFGMAFEGSGSREIMTYQGADYQITLDGRGGDANQILVSDTGTSLISFNEGATIMMVEDPAAVGLPAEIPVGEYETRVEQQALYVNILYLSLALIIAGVGYLKANISTIVGSLYNLEDKRRDSGFTLFYMGINLGSFLSSFVCGLLGIYVGWGWGFGAAGIGMLIGLVIFLVGQPWLEGKADPPSVEKLKEKVLGPINIEMACYLTGIIIVAVSFTLIMYAELIPDGLVLGLGIAILIGLIAYCFTKLQGVERSRMFAAIYFVLAQIPFWALFEQAGSSLTLFTDRLVDRTIFGWSVPAPVFQSLNAGFIFLFAPIIAWMWVALAKKKMEPSTPVKFAGGVFLAGIGFLTLVLGMKISGAIGMTAVIFVFLIYWIHTMGELMVSPVGLSAVTKMAPARVVGMTMGAWFLYSGLSNYLAGFIAKSTGAETLGGQLTDVAAAKAGYVSVYTNVAIVAIGIAVVMLLIAPIIKKWMHMDVHADVSKEGADPSDYQGKADKLAD
ncbi:peptide MFS transporter [Ponticaulis sp.]|uniref:peptide MFS transporter n=1 Tax=Ponticaulis sp. TaxID=2020902 RepID=UPI000B727268|nr:peptide MFS transporter [Ponticaulis sp.]MAI90851.1 MFS transporter [Ponticaulis sp.]OUX98826.1 MAG: MFS transporter [Hyphomonadaceae bacterium TMED5]|tara:strand:- start:11812 stop:13617 length:1806 start_codon:yes stop_codon:yes gene_type:complete